MKSLLQTMSGAYSRQSPYSWWFRIAGLGMITLNQGLLSQSLASLASVLYFSSQLCMLPNGFVFNEDKPILSGKTYRF